MTWSTVLRLVAAVFRVAALRFVSDQLFILLGLADPGIRRMSLFGGIGQ